MKAAVVCRYNICMIPLLCVSNVFVGGRDRSVYFYVCNGQGVGDGGGLLNNVCVGVCRKKSLNRIILLDLFFP